MDLSGARKGVVEVDPGFDLVHAEVLKFFPELVSELGGDADALAREAGVDPKLFQARRSNLGYRAMAGLLELASERLQAPDFGMRLAIRQGGGRTFGPMGVVMRNSNTLGEALDYVVNAIRTPWARRWTMWSSTPTPTRWRCGCAWSATATRAAWRFPSKSCWTACRTGARPWSSACCSPS
jgi:hypothetical protein